MTKLEVLRARREMYLRAEAEILNNGQSVELEGLKMTRADLGTLRKELHEIEVSIREEESRNKQKSRSRLRVVVPV